MNKKIKKSFLELIQSKDKDNIRLAVEIAKGIPELQKIIDNCLKVFRCLMADAEEDHIFWTSTIFGEDIPAFNSLEQIMFFNRQSTNHSFQYAEEIPPEMAEMPYFQNLEKLGITHGEVKAIPPEIGQLQKLKELDLGYNEIQSVPAEVGDLKNLRSLGLSNNQIEYLPSEIGKLSNLTFLNLSKNKDLKTLPESIKNLQSLQLLYLEECGFSIKEIQKLQSWLPECEINL